MENLIFGGPRVDIRGGGQHQKWLDWGEGRNFGCAVQKNTTKKKFRRNGVSASKNTLKTPHGPFLKKGGGFQNPPRYPLSQPPSLVLGHVGQLRIVHV